MTGTNYALPEEASVIFTLLRVPAWKQALADHPDKKFVRYILMGIYHDFHIGLGGGTNRAVGAQRNMLSALKNPVPMDEHTETERAAGRMVEVDPVAYPGVTIHHWVFHKKG